MTTSNTSVNTYERFEAADVATHVHSTCSDKACPICRPLTVILSKDRNETICDECGQPLKAHVDGKRPGSDKYLHNNCHTTEGKQ